MKGMRCLRIGESLATCVLALITLLLFSLIFLFGSNHLSYAQGIGNDPQATGLILMTPEEVEAFRSTHPKVEKVLPNDIALERVNEARAKKGLPSLLGVGTVPRGKEIVSSDSRGVSGVDPLFSASLFVDNSTLPCFPVIRNQSPLGSCTTFATTYYQLTHMVGLIRHTEWNNKNEVNTTKFSPRWTYNFQRDSANNGSSFWDNYNVLQNNGACTWAEFPYDGRDYKQWCMNPNAWENAINYRIDPISYITDDQLEQIKGLLNTGYVFTFGTYVSNWQYTTIKNNPGPIEDDAFVGKDIAYWVNGTTGGHAMTIVGYNDAIWTDVNNNAIIDIGELGAFRIANSWGAGWGDSGFTWLAYDALKAISGVLDGPISGRVPAFPEGHVYVMTLKTEYIPKMLAKFTINHAKRNQLVLHLGISDASSLTPTITWYPGMFDLHGGEYAFDGRTKACDGTFVLDFTDILLPENKVKKYYLGVFDSKSGDPATLSSFSIREVINGLEPYTSDSLPLVIDKGSGYVTINHTFDSGTNNYPPLAKIIASPTSGAPPLSVNFNGTDSSDLDGSISKYIWNFGDTGSSPMSAGVDNPITYHIYNDPGIYAAKLSVTDNIGVTSSSVVIITVGALSGGEMHVSDITMSLKTAGVNVNAIATVIIVDASNASVSGATVSGHWSGATSDTDSGVTDSSGKVALQSNVVKKPNPGTTFTFTVDNVVKTGLTYNSGSNVETSDFIKTPSASPALVKVYPTGLENPYPSPGNPEMWIPFTLSDEKHVVIKIYSIAGQLVRTLDLGQKSPGAYINKDKAAYWDGKSEVGEQIASGIYFCIMKAGDFTASRKMVIAK
jgi:PKD repeat protein